MDESNTLTIMPKKFTTFQNVCFYFLVYSFIGWIMECLYAIILLGHFVNRGFLSGPLCPIYGSGALILIFMLSKHKKNAVKLFTVSAIAFSLLEYIVSFCLEVLFRAKFWDYTNDFLNLNGRISIAYSFAWGIMAILFLDRIHPFVEKKLKNISYNKKLWFINIGMSLFILDSFITILFKLNVL